MNSFKKFILRALSLSVLIAGSGFEMKGSSISPLEVPALYKLGVAAAAGFATLLVLESRHYQKSHIKRSKGVAKVNIDEQNDFSVLEKALKYNEAETLKVDDIELLSYDKSNSVKSDSEKKSESATGSQRIRYAHGLPVDNADECFFRSSAVLTEAARKAGLLVYHTRDAHPRNSPTFTTTHGVKHMEKVPVLGKGVKSDGSKGWKWLRQIIWNPHCISGTCGAELVNQPSFSRWASIPFLRLLTSERNDKVRDKGATNESYSAVRDTYGNDLGFIGELNDHGIGGVIISGLAGGHCVDNSAWDLAVHGNKKVVYLVDQTRWITSAAKKEVAKNTVLVTELSDQDKKKESEPNEEANNKSNINTYRKERVDQIRALNEAGVKFFSTQDNWDQKVFVDELFKDADVEYKIVKSLQAVQNVLVQDMKFERTGGQSQTLRHLPWFSWLRRSFGSAETVSE